MRERIIKTMESVFEQPITDKSSVDNVENWDSLKHLQMIEALEREFDVRIPDEDTVNMINFKLIEFIIDEQIHL